MTLEEDTAPMAPIIPTDAVCDKCGSPDVQVAYPAWFRALDGRLMSVDFEADPVMAWCPRCEERTGDGDTGLDFAP